MRKEIYTIVDKALSEIVDDNNQRKIKHVDFWNDQIRYVYGEKPFMTPAVFVEFSPIRWSNLLNGVRESTVEFRLHVVTANTLGDWKDVIESLDILEEIHNTLFGWSKPGEIGTITLIASDTDHDFDELREDIETYSCHVRTKNIY